MLQRFKNDEGGFTLIELLVVILIVGILAAIALPTFLGQQKKGQDASAKSNARNLVSHVESCFTDTQDYTPCTDASAEIKDSGLPIGTGSEQVSVSGQSLTGYTITANSKSGNVFVITKTPTGAVRTCTTKGSAGCPASGNW